MFPTVGRTGTTLWVMCLCWETKMCGFTFYNKRFFKMSLFLTKRTGCFTLRNCVPVCTCTFWWPRTFTWLPVVTFQVRMKNKTLIYGLNASALPISSMIKLLPASRYGSSKRIVYNSIQVHCIFYMESTWSFPFGPLFEYKPCIQSVAPAACASELLVQSSL